MSLRGIAAVAALPLIGLSSFAHAQADREEMWEIGGTLLDLSSLSVSGENGSSLYVDDETGFGFSGAYNFTNRFALGMDITFSDPQYRATRVPELGPPEVVSTELGLDVIHFKAIINLLDNDLTPYVEVGAGWTSLDSNIVEGVSSPGCWWDPWWGYTCPVFYDTFTDTRTSWSYGVGLRYDMDSDFVLKVSWGELEIDKNRGEDIVLDSIQLTAAWRF